MSDPKKYIPVCFSTDDRFAQYCMVAIASLLHNANEQDNLKLYILDGGLSRKNKKRILNLKKIKGCEIQFIKINNLDYKNFYISNSRYTVASYYRISIPTLIPDEKKVIYLDCDVIVKKSVWDLYLTDIAQFHLAAAKTQTSEKNKKRLQMPQDSTYYCAGVMLINLEKWRKDKISKKLFNHIHHTSPEKLKNIDQDAVNALLFSSIKAIPQNWNAERRTDLAPTPEYKKILANPYIIHYISADKPWHPHTKQDTREYKKYLKLSLRK